MKTVGLLALGGAMGLKFEDLSYDNLRASFSKVRQDFWDSRTINLMSNFQFWPEPIFGGILNFGIG